MLFISAPIAASGGAFAQADWPGTPGTQAINQFLYAERPYDTAKDFAPVSFVVHVPNVLVVNPAQGAKID